MGKVILLHKQQHIFGSVTTTGVCTTHLKRTFRSPQHRQKQRFFFQIHSFSLNQKPHFLAHSWFSPLKFSKVDQKIKSRSYLNLSVVYSLQLSPPNFKPVLSLSFIRQSGHLKRVLRKCILIQDPSKRYIQGDFFNWPSPENVSRLAPPKFAWSGPP